MTSVEVKTERFGPMTNDATTIRDIISPLRSSFAQIEFESVAAMLENRENRLNANITDLKLRLETLGMLYTNLDKKHEELAVEKLQLEAQVKKYKIECEDYVEKYTIASEDLVKVEFGLKKVELDLKVVTDRDNRAREKSAKLMVEKSEEIKKLVGENERLGKENERLGKENENSFDDFEKERKEKEIEMIKLKEKIAGLIGAKTKAEESARVWGERFKELKAIVQELDANTPLAPVDGNLEVANPQRENNSSPAASSTHDLPMDDHMASRSSGTGFRNVIEIDDNEEEMHTTGIASASKTGNDNGRSNQMDPAPALSSKSKRPLGCTQVNTGSKTGNDNGRSYQMYPAPALSSKSKHPLGCTQVNTASKTRNDNGRIYHMYPAPALSSKSKRPLGCTQINTGIDDVTQSGKRKRNATSPHMTKTMEDPDYMEMLLQYQQVK